MKCCTKCKIEKPLTEFYKHKGKKSGLMSECKSCKDVKNREWREENPDKVKEIVKKWQEKNPDKCKEYFSKWKEENPEKLKEYQDEYQKKYNKENREKRREIERRYALKKRIKNQNAWVYLKDYPLL